MKINEVFVNELDREKKAQTANNIFMRFGVKNPISTVAGQDADPYVVGYAGFANTPADVKFSDAKWKFYNLNRKEDFVGAIKKMMADKTFTAAGGVTIYVDSKGMLKKFPAYGDFIAMVSRMGGDKIRVEFKPDPEDGDSEKGAGKKRVKAKWANPRDEYDTPDPTTTRYFQVTSPRLMSMLRRNDRVMQYYRPNRNAFVMGQKDFAAFVQAFGKDDIKIVDKFREDVGIDEAPNARTVSTNAKLVSWGPAAKKYTIQQVGDAIVKNAERYSGTNQVLVKKLGQALLNYTDTNLEVLTPKEIQRIAKLISINAKAAENLITGGISRLGSVEEMTSAGSVATVAMPLGTTKKKKKTTLIKR
jgi:hypothetical protein